MARTAAGTLLTEWHYTQQAALRARTVQEVMRLYPAWHPSDPASYQAFEDAVVLLVQMRGQQSAALASRYYEFYRIAETGTALVSAIPVVAVAEEAILRAAIGATTRGALGQALQAGQTFEQARASALVQVSGAASRRVSDAGRYTVLQAVDSDEKALGWCRVTGGDPCAWCSMLASRGPVYKGDADSIEIWDHDHGDCSAEPAYLDYQWPAKNTELRQAWDASQRDPQYTGSALNQFRQYLDQDTSQTEE